MALIDELLPKVMADIGSIGKGQENTHQHYRFRGIDDALNHAGPILTKHGLSVGVECEDYKVERHVVQLDDDRERVESYATLAMKITFYAQDGSTRINRLVAEGQDYGGDKATNKAMAAAFKYGIFFGLVIPVGEGAIEDSDRDPKQEQRQRQQPRGADKPNGREPMKECPYCHKQAVIPGKAEYGGGFVCWKNKGGCGHKFTVAQWANPHAKTDSGEPRDYITELNRTLRDKCKCMNPEDANAVIFCVTEHEYQSVEQARSTPEDAKRVLEILEAAAKDDPYETMLQKAHDELDATSKF